ncbi:hypothetical protein DPM33_31680 [Mesorhizobium hawassense]|uniref:Uncharacterized protein n=1 Tax=Mesorhizobium hawassense TaxID=1209954 RepID=A0A330H6S8_9HYPH|nr:hypothetical protein [Mesorhizobium hawassense]RAZ84343.1 hypothetical protein DPM33_31680 [Mesorhizobium hawassense]
MPSNPRRRCKKLTREPFKIDDGHTHLPVLALPVEVPRQCYLMPQRRADVLPAGSIVAMPEWPFAWALHGILLRSVSSADNLLEARERGAGTGVIKS